MHSEIYELIWFKLCIMIMYYWAQHFETSLTILTLIQGHRDVRKQKLLHQLSLRFLIKLDGIGILLRLVGLVNIIPSLSRPISIRGKEPYYMILSKDH